VDTRAVAAAAPGTKTNDQMISHEQHERRMWRYEPARVKRDLAIS